MRLVLLPPERLLSNDVAKTRQAKLKERVEFIHESIGTDALVEQFIDGRELYVGVLGNERLQVFPVWEMDFSSMPEGAHRIATDRVNGNCFVLEANANPHLALGEDFAESAKRVGLEYPDLLQRIVNFGLKWEPERAG